MLESLNNNTLRYTCKHCLLDELPFQDGFTELSEGVFTESSTQKHGVEPDKLDLASMKGLKIQLAESG